MYRRLPFVSLDLERLGLGHIKNREALMRNLVNGYDIGSLKRLADVAEPLEGYERNPAGKIYEFHYAFNRFADITLADAPDARAFDLLVKRYQLTKRIQTKDSIRTILEEWRDNHNEILTIIEASPALAEVVDLSENLKNISIIGLEALELKSKEMTIDQRKAWYQSAMKALDSAREQVARTQLQVIDAISNLIKFETAQISAIKASDEIIIDGNLEEWNKVKWDYFLPLLNRGWNDTCFYAAQWDDQRLYFAFKVTNDNLQAHKRYRDEEGLHLDDGVEILFDTDHDGSLEWNKDDIAYHVNILNAIMDDKGLNDQGQYDNSWNGNAETYVKVLGTINDAKDDDEGYWVEFSIDWEELGREPEPNLTLGVNVCVNDTDDLHQEYRYYDYMGLSVFHHPAGFADLVLVE